MGLSHSYRLFSVDSIVVGGGHDGAATKAYVTSPGYPSLHEQSDQRQSPVQPGEELAGKYRVERVIGAGAMGVVVEAWHIELEQQVAVKFLYPEFARNTDGAERFRREARAAVRIRNEHVARVLDVGVLAGKDIPYIVMEFLQGRDLSRELSEHGPLPVSDAVRHVLQACEAVAEAHKQGIVHRDLKPANLFLTERPNGQRMIKVLDFGISKVNAKGAQQFSLTDTATLMGSPAYMSPEQLESSRNVDGRADIWSLGVILHELILGAVPFGGESVPQLVRAILSGARRKLTDKDASLADLEEVVARCLCQDRSERFQNVAALCEALQPFADSNARTMVGPGLPSPSDTERTSPGDAAPDDAPSPHGAQAAGGVESAWGHTQRGRRGSWPRRGASAAALVALVGLAAYWAWSRDPGLGVPEAPLASPAARPTEPPAHILAPPAPEPPTPKSEGPAPSTDSESSGAAAAKPLGEAPRVSPVSPPREAGPILPTAPRAAAPTLVPLGVPAAVATKGPAPASQPSPARTPDTKPAAGALGPHAKFSAPDEPAAASKAPESDPLDKPKPEPSNKNGIDLPDFGGRE